MEHEESEHKTLDVFEIWTRKRMQKISGRQTLEEVFAMISEDGAVIIMQNKKVAMNMYRTRAEKRLCSYWLAAGYLDILVLHVYTV